MYKPIQTVAFPVVVSAALTACGGGGGGGGVRDVPSTSFTSFQDVRPNQRVVMTGISQTVTGDVNQFGTISNISAGALDEASTVSLTYGSSGNLSRIDINTPTTSIAAGDVGCSSGVCTAENATAAVIAIDATHPAFGWNYQSYGVWLNDTSATSLQAGAISAGAVTPGTAVPLTGTANFNGASSAFFVDGGGVPFFTTAVMTAVVNFGNQNIILNTSGTQAGNLVTGSIGPRPELDLSGTLSYPEGVNRFTGTLSTSHPAFLMSGPATGRFFGPAAQEMGGTYDLSGSGGRMIGAFGGKQ
jgi:hypothetical protein